VRYDDQRAAVADRYEEDLRTVTRWCCSCEETRDEQERRNEAKAENSEDDVDPGCVFGVRSKHDDPEDAKMKDATSAV
jgi:hypothetical protein